MGLLRSKISASRVLAVTACVSFSLALGACGGAGDAKGDSASDNASDNHAASGVATPEAAQATQAAQSAQTVDATGSNAASASAEPARAMAAADPDADVSTDRFIVKYKSATAEGRAASAVQSKLDRLAGTLPAKARHLRRMGGGSDVVMTGRKLNAAETRAFMRAMAADPDVDYVEPDIVMTVNMVPNDPDYGRQWNLSSNLKPNNRFAGIRAEGAWDWANGKGAVIALVDDGITSHSDLNANVLPGYDFTATNRGGNGTNPGVTYETCTAGWHGTHVAGIMAALTNNGIGMAGIASAAKIVPVRVMNACGSGFLSDAADGILWAAGGSIAGVPVNPRPATVINASLGGAGACSITMQNAVDYAASQRAVVVVSAGNSGADARGYSPANCRNVITVGASNGPGLKWVSSNFGATVDIAAPGEEVWSTFNNGTVAPGSEGYSYLSGTSMAAPAVSGVVALVQSVAPAPLSFAEMRTLLTQTVQPFPSGRPDQPIGPGILDASAAVVAARSGKIPSAADFSCSEAATLMQVTCKDLSTARGAPIRSWSWNFGEGDPAMVRTQSLNPYNNYDKPGTYDITLTVTDSTGAVSRMTRPFRVALPAMTELSAAVPVAVAGKNGDMQNYSLTVPAGVKTLTFTLAPVSSGVDGQSQVASLYLRSGTPSVLHPDCQSVMARGAPATCTVSNPAPGTYYGVVAASTKLSDLSLLATYTR
jgi:serine protease